jgi:single-stranded-DNA-specific exonuclease
MQRWQFQGEPHIQDVELMRKSINVSTPIARILVQRGINDFEAAKFFFRPDLSMLHNPFLMKDMDKAIERIIRALHNNEKILIYGDYDVDGTTSVAMFYDFWGKYHKNIDYYIPDRYREGYGISDLSIEYAEKNGISLVITLDCGTKSTDKIAKALSLGIDFIVCDHHTTGDELPPAYAVLNPKRKDCPYPFKELSGCGVGYKLLQGLVTTLELEQSVLNEQLDFLAISIACDVVPIIDENRILVKYGLELINEGRRPSVQALLDVSFSKRTDITVSDLVFQIGPRINATGRISHANQSVELLLSQKPDDIKKMASSINTKNNIRKDYDARITAEALQMIEDRQLQDKKSTVLFKSDWHKGIIGIVASRCVECYYRPTVILTESQGKATGSARSVPNFDIYEAITACEDLLLQFGGHKYAAGLTLRLEEVEQFTHRFEEIVSSTIKDEDLIPKIEIDTHISLDEINWGFYNVLNQMAPFGPMNMRPVFAASDLQLKGYPTLLKGKHLKMRVKQKNGKLEFDAVGFNMPQFYEPLVNGFPFSICFTVEPNEFGGSRVLQLMLRDIQILDKSLATTP